MLVDGTASAFINQQAKEVSLIEPSSASISFTDNKSLHDSTNTTTQITDQHIFVKMSAPQNMQDQEEIIKKENQIAVLPKRQHPKMTYF